MKIPAIPISRWKLTLNEDVYRDDGYVGIGTSSPGGMLGLKNSSVYITVDSSNNLILVDPVEGSHTLTELADHGSMNGLDDDDHLHYLNRDGSRPMIGDLDLNNFEISNLGGISGSITTDGYVLPSTDDAYGLGLPTQRWSDLFLGHNSLHIVGTASEVGSERNWNIGLDSDGDLRFVQGIDDKIFITESGLLTIGGTTSAFPAIKRSSSSLQIRLADDSDFANLYSGQLDVAGNISVTGTVDGIDISTDAAAKDQAILFIRTDLDGYQNQLDTHDALFTYQSSVNTDLLNSADAYQSQLDAHDVLFGEQSNANSDILNELDSYQSQLDVLSAFDTAQSSVNIDILSELDSYQSQLDVHDNLFTYQVSTNTDILSELDSYQSQLNVLTAFDTAQVSVNTDVLSELDSYQSQLDVLTAFDIAQSSVNTDVLSELDSYQSQLDVLTAFDIAQASVNIDILNNLDGYALSLIENQRWIDSSQQRQDLRNAIDGYVLDNVFTAFTIAQSSVNTDILNDLDGYTTTDIFTSFTTAQTSVNTDVLNELDGYALSVIENQRWIDSSQQRQNIRDALDGYVLNSIFTNFTTAQTSVNTDVLNELDSYQSQLNILDSFKNAQSSVNTDILNDIDGYALIVTEDQRWVDSSQQRQDLRDAIDGYAINDVFTAFTIAQSSVNTDILNDLDSYQSQITTHDTLFTYQTSVNTDILNDLDGYQEIIGYTEGTQFHLNTDSTYTSFACANIDAYGSDVGFGLADSSDVSIRTGGGNIVFVDPIVVGIQQFVEDTGPTNLYFYPVSSTPSAGDEMSVALPIDSVTIATIYAQADGAGGIQAPSLKMGAARFQGSKGSDVASADEITLGDGNYFDITGTTTINHINKTDWQAGAVVTLQFDASVTVTHNSASPTGTEASILLAGASDFNATADDTLTLIYDGVTWRETSRAVI